VGCADFFPVADDFVLGRFAPFFAAAVFFDFAGARRGGFCVGIPPSGAVVSGTASVCLLVDFVFFGTAISGIGILYRIIPDGHLRK
jgi:hypothetical protein